MNRPLQSDSLDQFAPAFLRVQAALDPVHKNAENTHLRTKYADLAAVQSACFPALNDNQIIVTQTIVPVLAEPPFFFDTIKVANAREFRVPTQVLAVLRTALIHISGQFIASEIPLACPWGDAQRLGGTITYLRRYALATIVGLVQDDDDGHAARGGNGQAPQRRRPLPPPRQQPRREPGEDDRWDDSEQQLPPRRQSRDDYRDRRQEVGAAFTTSTNGAPALPNFGKRGFYGWIQQSDSGDPNRTVQSWFADFGQRNDFPNYFQRWTDDQIAIAYDAFSAQLPMANGR
jgi:hypothetical protein